MAILLVLSDTFYTIEEGQQAVIVRFGWPAGETLKEIPAEQEETTRTILAETRKIVPQYGIELVDVRIKRLDYIESVREDVYARMISERKRIAQRRFDR